MNKLNIKPLKDIEESCWQEFEDFLNKFASDETLKLPFPLIWEIWYDGYCSNYPMELDVNPAMLVKMKKRGK
jgi:hypothetical protein